MKATVRWRKTDDDVYWAGNRTHGACIWYWSNGMWRGQYWVPGSRLVTLRASRPLGAAKKAVERCLARRSAATTRGGGT